MMRDVVKSVQVIVNSRDRPLTVNDKKTIIKRLHLSDEQIKKSRNDNLIIDMPTADIINTNQLDILDQWASSNNCQVII